MNSAVDTHARQATVDTECENRCPYGPLKREDYTWKKVGCQLNCLIVSRQCQASTQPGTVSEPGNSILCQTKSITFHGTHAHDRTRYTTTKIAKCDTPVDFDKIRNPLAIIIQMARTNYAAAGVVSCMIYQILRSYVPRSNRRRP